MWLLRAVTERVRLGSPWRLLTNARASVVLRHGRAQRHLPQAVRPQLLIPQAADKGCATDAVLQHPRGPSAIVQVTGPQGPATVRNITYRAHLLRLTSNLGNPSIAQVGIRRAPDRPRRRQRDACAHGGARSCNFHRDLCRAWRARSNQLCQRPVMSRARWTSPTMP
jgi:hypothetical protein